MQVRERWLLYIISDNSHAVKLCRITKDVKLFFFNLSSLHKLKWNLALIGCGCVDADQIC